MSHGTEQGDLRSQGGAEQGAGVERFTADAFGPSHRWVVFVCETLGHPMKVGYTEDEYAEDQCPCGAPLVPVVVGPVANDSPDGGAVHNPELDGAS